jgi:hypothetical protein
VIARDPFGCDFEAIGSFGDAFDSSKDGLLVVKHYQIYRLLPDYSLYS